MADDGETFLNVALNMPEIAGACDAFINGVSPGLTIRNSLIFTLDHTFVTDWAAGPCWGKLLRDRAAEREATLMDADPS